MTVLIDLEVRLERTWAVPGGNDLERSREIRFGSFVFDSTVHTARLPEPVISKIGLSEAPNRGRYSGGIGTFQVAIGDRQCICQCDGSTPLDVPVFGRLALSQLFIEYVPATGELIFLPIVYQI